MNVNFQHIQIYPTNQYTPAVHRLLQVAANLYDATTNRVDLKSESPFMPHVFSPAFRRSGSGLNAQIWISGYVEETDTSVLTKPIIDLTDPIQAQQISVSLFGVGDTNHVIHGIPLIIGAKKGLPNFNEFALENALQVTRRLEFRRNNTNSPVNATNQLYIFGISGNLGVEAWNSYSNTYPRALQMIVSGDIGLAVTNELGSVTYTNYFVMSAVTNLPASTWTGYTTNAPALLIHSFQIPLSNNISFLQTNIGFLQSAIGFEDVTNLNPQLVGNTFPVPQWFINLRTRLRYILVDTELNRIVDYVSVSSAEQPLDLTYRLAGNKQGVVRDVSAAGLWATNRIDNSNNQSVPTVGIMNQILLGRGDLGYPNWNSYLFDPTAGNDVTNAVKIFKANLYYPLLGNPNGITISNVFYAPFMVSHTLYQSVSWQANDPLVHYLKSDLTDVTTPNTLTDIPQLFITNYSKLGSLNPRYKPWGGNPFKTIDPDAYNLALKDPLVSRSDKWSFPTNVSSDYNWIAHVHRGTPWQTLYLKSSNVVINPTWMQWTGDTNLADAQISSPTNDWHLVASLLWLLNPSNSNQQISANNPNTNAWRKVLDGMVVLTNTTPDVQLSVTNASPTFDFLTVSSNSPQAGIIANAVTLGRSNQPNQQFRHPSEVLGTPELSVNSPFLNTSNSINNLQQIRGISDEAYERIPVLLLPLLRADSGGVVSSTNGQLAAQFTGYDGYSYAIQASSNLFNWAIVSTNYPTNGLITFVEPVGTNQPSRFYRSILLP